MNREQETLDQIHAFLNHVFGLATFSPPAVEILMLNVDQVSHTSVRNRRSTIGVARLSPKHLPADGASKLMRSDPILTTTVVVLIEVGVYKATPIFAFYVYALIFCKPIRFNCASGLAHVRAFST